MPDWLARRGENGYKDGKQKRRGERENVGETGENDRNENWYKYRKQKRIGEWENMGETSVWEK